jgi:hypothetical protein
MPWFAIAMGVFSMVAGITHFLIPREQLHMASGIQPGFFESLRISSTAFTIHYWAITASTLAGAAVVIGIGSALDMQQGIILMILNVGAVCGFIVTSLSFGLMLKRAVHISRIWPSLSQHAKETIRTNGLPNLDPFGLFGFGLVGIWMIAFNMAAINAGTLHVWHGLVGCVGGLLYLSVLAGMMFRIAFLIDVSAALGCVVIAPIWSIVLAMKLF